MAGAPVFFIMYIGLLSDTHGFFTDEFREFLEPVEQLWHAGDFGGDAEFTKQFSDFKPLVGVYGNCDGQDVRLVYPEYQCFECEGRRVLMIHIGGRPGRYDWKARTLIERYRPDIFVCGHSHILAVKNDAAYNLLYINPGACGIQGWQIERTALRVHIDDGEIHNMELFRLPRNAR